MPVLGSRIGEVLDAGELELASEDVPVGEDGAVVTETVLRYFDHVLPVRAGTEGLPMAELVDQQWYRLAHWRVADEELNYRRFFDVDTLAAVRVEDPAVFEATHRVLLDLFADGVLDGFRIDHPDGLADPRGYLRRLAGARGPAGERPYVVVEKILEGEEQLPADWPCDGTTGYDTLRRITGVLVNPSAEAPLTLLHHEIGTSTGAAVGDFHALVDTAKREVVQGGQYAEVHRLVDLLVDICADDIHLRDHTRRSLHDSVVELLVAMDRYRAYVVPGEAPDAEAVAVVSEAAHRAREKLPEDRRDTLDLVAGLVLGRDLVTGSEGALAEGSTEQGGAAGLARRRELVVRFQQTCGPVMAKGVEDTAFYRWQRFVALNEVGGDPARFGTTPEELHAAAERTRRDLAGHHVGAVHPRHQAQRGRPDPAARRGRGPRALGRRRPRLARGRRAAAPGRPGRRRHRAAAVADPRGHMAHHRGPPARLPGEGDPRGQAPHHLDQPGRGVRGAPWPTWRAASSPTRPSPATSPPSSRRSSRGPGP